jgi:hypothetical protein
MSDMNVEKTDAKFSTTTAAIVGLLISMIAGIVLVFALYSRSVSTEKIRAAVLNTIYFPKPQPGRFTAVSLRELRASETTELQAYRWQNQDHTEAVVPIDRALEIYEGHHAD